MGGTALDDLIVVEFAQMVSGPMCGKMFADRGADDVTLAWTTHEALAG
jgi:crotonobetainyl-CoA:carnitine CoA-transferase CaiB-like acyl-CoA transferase